MDIDGTLVVRGTWSPAATSPIDFTGGTRGTLDFRGNTDFDPQGRVFGDVRFDVGVGNAATLVGPLDVAGDLTVSSGTVDLAGNDALVASNLVVGDASDLATLTDASAAAPFGGVSLTAGSASATLGAGATLSAGALGFDGSGTINTAPDALIAVLGDVSAVGTLNISPGSQVTAAGDIAAGDNLLAISSSGNPVLIDAGGFLTATNNMALGAGGSYTAAQSVYATIGAIIVGAPDGGASVTATAGTIRAATGIQTTAGDGLVAGVAITVEGGAITTGPGTTVTAQNVTSPGGSIDFGQGNTVTTTGWVSSDSGGSIVVQSSSTAPTVLNVGTDLITQTELTLGDSAQVVAGGFVRTDTQNILVDSGALLQANGSTIQAQTMVQTLGNAVIRCAGSVGVANGSLNLSAGSTLEVGGSGQPIFTSGGGSLNADPASTVVFSGAGDTQLGSGRTYGNVTIDHPDARVAPQGSVIAVGDVHVQQGTLRLVAGDTLMAGGLLAESGGTVSLDGAAVLDLSGAVVARIDGGAQVEAGRVGAGWLLMVPAAGLSLADLTGVSMTGGTVQLPVGGSGLVFDTFGNSAFFTDVRFSDGGAAVPAGGTNIELLDGDVGANQLTVAANFTGTPDTNIRRWATCGATPSMWTPRQVGTSFGPAPPSFPRPRMT